MKKMNAFFAIAAACAVVSQAAAEVPAAQAGFKEIGRLATIAGDVGGSSAKWLAPDAAPPGCTAYEPDYTCTPEIHYERSVARLREKVKEAGGAFDIFDAGARDAAVLKGLARAKYELRRMAGDAVRAIPCRTATGADADDVTLSAVRNFASIIDGEALPRGIVENASYRECVSHDPEDDTIRAKRRLSCATFARATNPLRLYWYSDRMPDGSDAYGSVTLRVPGAIVRPVWVDMVSGRVFAVPEENVSSDGKTTLLKNIPVWDSPVLVAAANCVPREVDWKKLSPREIVDYWYKPGQFENHMKALPPEGSAPWMEMKTEDFLPCIDEFGQFRWRDWPGKTACADDLKRDAREEARDLAAHPGPADWDAFGGWKGGPQFAATGRFRTEKVDGKWWLVDPEGRLFWSFGPVRVTPSSGMTPLNGDPCKPNRGNALPLPDRDCLFSYLPPGPGGAGENALSKFWTTRDELLAPFYLARGQTRVFDFSAANLYRKYGPDWFDKFADVAHRRLRSWGANTIANSSDLSICLMDRTPYAERVECESRTIEGSYGMWKKFRDPWDESFSRGVASALETHGREAHDPWCIGFFVDNEINWGYTPHQLAEWTLQSPAGQPAKAAAVAFFRAKYGEIAKLNAAWKSSYVDWDDLLHSILLPGPDAKDDLAAFTREIVETYFRKTREAVKSFDPQLLYLGCRFVGSKAKPWVIGPCVKYCDVVSYNIYLETVGDWRLPDGLDAPVMVGEFHFGATDRGPFGTGVCVAADQADRAEKLKAYVRSALENPQIVGVHWHQFADQATTGRFDGEYLQVGWTDICDKPYPETIAAVRETGYSMYRTRMGEKKCAGSAARIEKDVPYADRPGCVLDVKTPASAKGLPVVVWFHGGGLGGGKKSFLPFSGGGICQVAAGYRLLGKEAASGEDCIEDAAAAVAWTFANAGKYGWDPEKIFVAGYSAGGYLAMMAGMDASRLAKHGVDNKSLAGIIAVSGQATKHFNIRKFAGDEDPQFLPKIDSLAPLAHVSADLPPILCICGAPPYEWKCRAEENRLLVASCAALGHKRAKYVELPFCTHARIAAAAVPYVEMFVRRGMDD